MFHLFSCISEQCPPTGQCSNKQPLNSSGKKDTLSFQELFVTATELPRVSREKNKYGADHLAGEFVI